MSANNVLVGPMRREELRRAIELPARRAGLRVEPSLTSALVGDVADQTGRAAVALHHPGRAVAGAQLGRTLRRSAYERSGGVNGAVARLAERAYGRLSPPERERARAMLLRLTDAEQPVPVSRRVALSELETERDEDATAALAVLTESRLVTVDEDTIEVAHEALLREWPRLRAWLADDIDGRRVHQHLINAAAEWESTGREPAELYRGARLASALDWAASHDSGAERPRARVPRREPGGERARGGAAAASQSPAPVAAGRRRRPARRRGGRRTDRALRAPGRARRGHRRRRPAARGRGAQRGSPRTGASARQRRRRARRLARHPLQPALDAPAQPRDDRGPERRRRSVHVEGAQPRWSHARGR